MAQENYVEVARFGDAIVYRVVGLGSMAVSPAIWGLSEKMMAEEGVCKVVFELSSCTGLDSTFMGMLVGMVRQIAQREQGGWVCAVNVSSKARENLRTLGADKFILIKDAFPIDDIIMERLDAGVCSQRERLDVIRKAHKTLVEMDRANKERFGAFLESLEKEMPG